MDSQYLFEDEIAPPTHQAERRRNLAERRLSALAAAVRDHETAVSRYRVGAGPRDGHDAQLYRRLRQILGER